MILTIALLLAQQVPEGVAFEADIAYRQGSPRQKLDLAMPKERGEKPRPGIVFIHGGGWRGGDKARGQWRALPLAYAQKGYVCISVNYRLTDEIAFPGCVEDVKCAARWFRANAGKYNLDPERLGAYGNSAGAHLVAMLGLVKKDAGLEGDGPHADQSSLVQAVCASAIPTDFRKWALAARNHRALGPLLKGPGESLPERAAKASPITYVRPDAPPFLIVHGTNDGTVKVDQADSFVEALKEAGAKDVEYIRIEGAGHGVFGQHRQRTYPAMEKFFARVLRAP